MRTNTDRNWLEEVMIRLPMMRPGTLVVSSEGIGVFLGFLAGSTHTYGVKRGKRILLETCPILNVDHW